MKNYLFSLISKAPAFFRLNIRIKKKVYNVHNHKHFLPPITFTLLFEMLHLSTVTRISLGYRDRYLKTETSPTKINIRIFRNQICAARYWIKSATFDYNSTGEKLKDIFGIRKTSSSVSLKIEFLLSRTLQLFHKNVIP